MYFMNVGVKGLMDWAWKSWICNEKIMKQYTRNFLIIKSQAARSGWNWRDASNIATLSFQIHDDLRSLCTFLSRSQFWFQNELVAVLPRFVASIYQLTNSTVMCSISSSVNKGRWSRFPFSLHCCWRGTKPLKVRLHASPQTIIWHWPILLCPRLKLSSLLDSGWMLFIQSARWCNQDGLVFWRTGDVWSVGRISERLVPLCGGIWNSDSHLCAPEKSL